jgi:6-phosphofructokinase 1
MAKKTTKKTAKKAVKKAGKKAVKKAVKKTPKKRTKIPRMPIRRIGICTGGGDAPGLNAVIRAATKTAYNFGWGVTGIYQGFDGLVNTNKTQRLDPVDIRGILNKGGTILGTTNRGNPFSYPVKVRGKTVFKDVSDKVMRNFKKLGLDALIVIGGDGTLEIAHRLFKLGMPIVGVPKTIDNDLFGTDVTFGYDTAVTTATEAIDKLHSTAQAHRRCMVTEVMGRYAGWIALNSGVSGGADVILIPEIPFNIDAICRKVKERDRRRRHFTIIVAAEGAAPAGGGMLTRGGATEGRQEVLLGGVGEWVAKEIHSRIGKDTRSLVLGHLQRGGHPTTFDRLLATRLGAAASRLIFLGKFGRMVGLKTPHIVSTPIKKAISQMKGVPLNHDTILSARALGISFGDGVETQHRHF